MEGSESEMSCLAPGADSLSGDGSSSPDVMSFEVDIVEEDIPARVEDLMRLSALGFFREAREQSLDLFSRQDDVFAVKMECMRLLFEQGDFEELDNYINTQFSVTESSEASVNSLDEVIRHLNDEATKHLKSWHASRGSERSTEQPEVDTNTQHAMVMQMRHLAMLNRKTRDQMTVGSNFVRHAYYKFDHSHILKCMDSPLQSVLFVLALYISAITGEIWIRPPLENLLRRLLEAGNYWASEHVLKFSMQFISSGEGNSNKRIWLNNESMWLETGSLSEEEKIERIGLEISSLLKSDVPGDGEVSLLSKLNLLQMFFEGYMDQWADYLPSNLFVFRKLLDRASQFERYILVYIHATSWKATRIRIRRELLMYDLSVAALTGYRTALRSLEELKKCAAANHDLRCVRGIELRQMVADAGHDQEIQLIRPTALNFLPENMYRRILKEKRSYASTDSKATSSLHSPSDSRS